MTFCTAINCIDGRVQLPVILYMQARTGAQYVDMVTEPGPELMMAGNLDSGSAKSILDKVDISIRAHGSKSLAIVAHHDCAGNPVSDAEHKRLLNTSVKNLEERYPQIEIIGLFVDKKWEVHEMIESQA